jgi:hypothetical protein
MTIALSLYGTDGMPRMQADRLIALMCAERLMKITIDNHGTDGPSHRAEDMAEKFAQWLNASPGTDLETRRRALIAAADLANPGSDWRPVIENAEWRAKFAAGITRS